MDTHYSDRVGFCSNTPPYVSASCTCSLLLLFLLLHSNFEQRLRHLMINVLCAVKTRARFWGSYSYCTHEVQEVVMRVGIRFQCVEGCCQLFFRYTLVRLYMYLSPTDRCHCVPRWRPPAGVTCLLAGLHGVRAGSQQSLLVDRLQHAAHAHSLHAPAAAVSGWRRR